jgi:hypothetical protein
MANNYLQFSEVIRQITIVEEKWLQEQLEVVHVFDGREYREHELPEELDPTEAQFIGCRAFRDMEDYDASEEDAGFCYLFDTAEDVDPDHWGRHLWIYADEGGDLDRVAHLVQKFLKTFRISECWSLTWSESCSKPRVGEFGGGALFVTAGEVKWQSSCSFIAAEQSAFRQLHQAKSAA